MYCISLACFPKETVLNRNLDDLGKLLLRLTLGALILMHGIAKIPTGPASIGGMLERVGVPPEAAWLVYIGEVVAPLALILGLWTRIAALVIAGNMAVAVALSHAGDLFSLGRSGGWALELQGMFFFTAVALALLGGGRYAVKR